MEFEVIILDEMMREKRKYSRPECFRTSMFTAKPGGGGSRKGDREGRRNDGTLGTEKWKVLLHNVTVLVL